MEEYIYKFGRAEEWKCFGNERKIPTKNDVLKDEGQEESC